MVTLLPNTFQNILRLDSGVPFHVFSCFLLVESKGEVFLQNLEFRVLGSR